MMRLFQNFGLYKSYLKRLRSLQQGADGFSERMKVFLQDRFGAVHLLKPVIENHQDAFFTNGNDLETQQCWAKENGMPHNASKEDILLAQIEAHRTEVLYNLDPISFPNSFLKRLPGSVKKTLAWRAAPSSHFDFDQYDLLLSNFPGINESMRARGCKTAYFFPAHDPVMDEYSCNSDRKIDVLFAGSYSRNHRRRAEVLDAVAELSYDFNVIYYLDEARATKLANSLFGLVGPLRKYRYPSSVRKITKPSVFGRQLYEVLSQAKVVINVAVDMAGDERGNMRCWEVLGCGAAMLSDTGRYPNGMNPEQHFLTYATSQEIVKRLRDGLVSGEWKNIAANGHKMIASEYSKDVQWAAFKKLVG